MTDHSLLPDNGQSDPPGEPRGAALTRRDVLALGLSTALGSLLPSRSVTAQSKYPDRVIRLVIPFPPGGVNDSVGRPWADKMKSLLGTVVVENIGGGGGSLGAADVARARPDGYTLLFGPAGILAIHALASKRPLFDPLKDFDPISALVVSCVAIVVHPDVPARTLTELADYARRNVGKLSYGSAGIGSNNHLAGEMFKSLANVPDITHVPYRGAGPAVSDLIAGHIPIAVPLLTAQVIDLHRAGKLRLLAVTSEQRVPAVLDIPTAVEAGIPGFVSQTFHGLFAPAGTPVPIAEQIAASTRTAMADDSLQRSLIASGFAPYTQSGPEQARQMLADEVPRWATIIKAIDLKLD